MEDNKEAEEVPTRGNEWEVVTLTASAYAAAPGPEEVESTDKGNEVIKDEEESPRAMFMSGHFVFPPSQHENLPIEPTEEEIYNKSVGDVDSVNLSPEGEEGNISDRGLGLSDDVHGSQLHDTEFESKALHGMHVAGEKHGILSASKFSSFQDEADISGSAVGDESPVFSEPNTPTQLNLDSPSDIPESPSPNIEDKVNESGLPCEAWWKRHAASLYAQAKEANAFWSVFVAAALMGLVILGQRWQQERWQAQQIKWQLNIDGEKTNWMMGSIYRFKDVLVGGNRRGSVIRASASADH